MLPLCFFISFEDSKGEQQKVSIKFDVPPLGKEVDNLNTLISTGSYSDVIDLTFGGNIVEWYQDGLILDLTEYVEKHMPNYKRFIDEHPEYEKYMTNDVDGERKYLSITGFQDALSIEDQFCGFVYRRDWIVKYGVQPDVFEDPMAAGSKRDNPDAGKAFSGYYSLDTEGNAVEHDALQENTNGDSWVDNVLFPSGNPNPVYISDWEWMFEIFQKAIDEQGITDGYVLSMYYPGYVANGELSTGFGGGNKTMADFENTNAWDGAVPYVIGSPKSAVLGMKI